MPENLYQVAIEGPDYCHLAGLVDGGRILFRSDGLAIYMAILTLVQQSLPY